MDIWFLPAYLISGQWARLEQRPSLSFFLNSRT